MTFGREELAARLKPEKAAFFEVRYSKHSTATKLSSALTSELRDIAQLDALIGSSTEELRYKDLRQRVSALLPRFKHLGFSDEKEWRFAIQRQVPTKALCFRVSDNKLVPYIEIGKANDLLPIESVRIGPGPDQELTAQSVRVFMSANGYNVPVELSDIPFRV